VLAASLLLVNSSLSDTWPLVHRKYREIDICFLEVFLAYLLICRPGVPCRKLFNKSLYSGITCVREMATAICQPRRANPDHLTSTSTVTRIMALTQEHPTKFSSCFQHALIGPYLDMGRQSRVRVSVSLAVALQTVWRDRGKSEVTSKPEVTAQRTLAHVVSQA
jgi:hypothetical protein